MSSLKSIENKARKYYFKKWRGSEKISPVFGEKVYLTKLGWNHIANHPRRVLVDKIIRLKKLPLAREVLETATTYQTFQKRGKYYLYGFQAIKGNTRVKVVVSSKGKGGKKLLFSVMFKNISRQEQKNIDRHNLKLIREFRRKYPKGVSPRRR